MYDWKAAIGYYVGQNVRLSFSDGSTPLFGVLSPDIPPDLQTVTLIGPGCPAEPIPCKQIANIEFVGYVTSTSFAKSEGEIGPQLGKPGPYHFPIAASGLDRERLRYGEFNYQVRCHLFCQKTTGGVKIDAKDINLIKATHRFPPLLDSGDFLYRFADGSCKVGRLARDGSEFTLSGEPLDREAVTDITRAPQINDYVIVSRKDGATLQGLVSATFPDGFAVMADDSPLPATVAFSDMDILRFRGTVEQIAPPQTAQILLNDRVRLPYSWPSVLKEPPLAVGESVTFIPGVNMSGLIAKHVIVDPTQSMPQTREPEHPQTQPISGTGVVIYWNMNSPLKDPFGYIGSTYMSRQYSLAIGCEQPRGEVSFHPNQAPCFRDRPIDPDLIYVVSYTGTLDLATGYKLAEPSSISIVKTFPRADYVKVSVAADGTIETLSTHKADFSAFLAQLKGVEAEITRRDGTVRHGTLKGLNAGQAELEVNEQRELIPPEEIADVRAYATISYFNAQARSGWLSTQHWFSASGLRDPGQAPLIAVGRRISFFLERTNRGNGFAATDIEILGGPVVRGKLTDYDGILCSIVPQGEQDGKQFLVDKAFLEFSQREKLSALNVSRGDTCNVAYFLREEPSGTYVVFDFIADITVGSKDTHSPDSQPAPAGAPTPPLQGSNQERLLLSGLPVNSSYPSDRIRFGLLTLYNPAFDYTKIVGSYPKVNSGTPKADIRAVAVKPVQLTHPEHIIQINTFKWIYLVCYVLSDKKTTVEEASEIPVVDGAYPIQVLQAFSRDKYTALRLDADAGCLVLTRALYQLPEGASMPTTAVPALQKGEDVFLVKENGSMQFCRYQGKTEQDVKTVYRFGVVTDYQRSAGLGTLNNCIDFSLAAAELKVVNILDNQMGNTQLHVIFAHNGNQVTEVRRITDEFLRLIPWKEGRVTWCDSTSRQFDIDKNKRHYLSVLSDGLVSSLKDNLKGQAVLFRGVSQLFLKPAEKTAGLVQMAVFVRCKTETATVQYDPGRDLYLGYRNLTVSYPLSGSKTALAGYAGEKVQVEFTRSTDSLRLDAWPAGLAREDRAPESRLDVDAGADEASGDLAEEPLTILCLAQVDLRQMSLTGVELDENGLPKDLEQAKTACRILQGRSDSDAVLARAKVLRHFPGVPTTQSQHSLLCSAFERRCKRLESDNNAVFGEWTYYLTLLLRYKKVQPSKNQTLSVDDRLYRLFVQDFYSRSEAVKRLQSGQAQSLTALLRHPDPQIGEFVSHILPLDKTNTDSLCTALKECPELSRQLTEYAAQTDDTISRELEVAAAIQALQRRYHDDKKRFAGRFQELAGQKQICAGCVHILKDMQGRFLKLVCKDDAERFARLQQACEGVCGQAGGQESIARRARVLTKAYQTVDALAQDILANPCRAGVELLIVNGPFVPERNILSLIKEETAGLLDQLYQEDRKPKLTCLPNLATIHEGQKRLWLIVENAKGVLPAKNIYISPSSLTEGVRVTAGLSLGSLAPGEQKTVSVDLEVDSWEPRAISLDCPVSFTYPAGFRDGTTVTKEATDNVIPPLTLQISSADAFVKDLNAENPYAAPAEGAPLEDGKMFFGRKQERQDIWNSIVRTSAGGEELIPGSTVILYGQKKCGKTSLVNQIRNDLQDSEALGRQAIILNFNTFLSNIGGPGALPNFYYCLYRRILNSFRSQLITNPRYADLRRSLLGDETTPRDETAPELPTLSAQNKEDAPDLFETFFRDFALWDGGKHRIVLFMDEFTSFCTTLLQRSAQDPSLLTLPLFIKNFSIDYGFIQVIIGHDAMIRSLGKMGVYNHTAEFAKVIELSALDRDAARQLVREPMEEAFGQDVYATPLGEKAVERLLELSGCHPTYLMRLCSKLFEHYLRSPGSQIILSDVDAVAKSYIQTLQSADFDNLAVEDGDAPGNLEERPTYQYLRYVAQLPSQSYNSPGQVKKALASSPSWKSGVDVEVIHALLVDRGVISITDDGQIKINVGLFVEYIRHLNGGNT